MASKESTNPAERASSKSPVKNEGPISESKHDTLKYHLLGPSLTKAGQDTVDQTKVSEVIYKASKGSKFFTNEEAKDKVLTSKIERILRRKAQLEKLDLSHDRRRADDYIAELELKRDLSQTIIHIDCDAFYAAVEELDRPELRDVPMAVGKGVLTTCNYHARKFGCRSGMAGFVAMKLCPQLICLPLNFEKYAVKAQEVRAVLAEYDPCFESASMDEAYLNITQYCAENEMDPEEAVSQLRREVHERALITVSAGIAANAKIAKICSNKNKPNGQFRVAPTRPAIIEFMRTLPTRKVNGIGRVFERELAAIGVATCGDLFEQRHLLSKLFGEKAFEFLINCYLGIGRTRVQPAESYERKSVGTERTFADLSGSDGLHLQLRKTADELEKDLARTGFKGRTICLKIKHHSYEVLTRQVCPPRAIDKAEDLYNCALPMLTKLEAEIPGLKLRLMGLRATHLVSTKKVSVSQFFGVSSDTNANATGRKRGIEDDETEEWEVWPEEEFEEAARQEKREDMEATAKSSQEATEAAATTLTDEQTSNTKSNEDNSAIDWEEVQGPWRHGKVILPNPVPERVRQQQQQKLEEEALEEEEKQKWTCPICGRPQSANDREFNDHVDFCLSREAIREAVKETAPAPDPPLPPVKTREESSDRSASPAGFALGRGETKRRKLFFQ